MLIFQNVNVVITYQWKDRKNEFCPSCDTPRKRLLEIIKSNPDVTPDQGVEILIEVHNLLHEIDN